MNLLIQICRYLTGTLFAISGLIKLIDPVGTQIKMEEYFEVFAQDFGSFFHYLVPLAFIIGVLMCLLEVGLGFALIAGLKPKKTIPMLLVLTVFFTFLTFYSAYFNKVTDCGCFGDALKLKPWHSFYKDIALLILILILWIGNKYILPAGTPKLMGAITVSGIVVGAFMALWAMRHQPMVDFRAYSQGANIAALMKPTAPARYKYLLEKDGKEFEFEQYPTDTSYHFKSMELQNPEDEPKIRDFSIWNEEGDYTQEILKGNKLIILVQKAHETEPSDFEKINQLIAQLIKKPDLKIQSIAITSSDQASFEQLRHQVQLSIPYYLADATVVKTIIRANPGIMLLKDGVIMGKWNYLDTPSPETIEERLK